MRKIVLLFSLTAYFSTVNFFAITLSEYLAQKSKELKDSSSLSELIEAAGEKRVVLMGESTHGTSEYYVCRAELTKRLISEKGFNFVAVEGDWASIYRLNQYVKGSEDSASSSVEIMKNFKRWPVWMWANYETSELVEWIKRYNENLPPDKKVGFYGMDVYGHWEAMDDLILYIESMLPDRYSEVKTMLEYFSSFRDDDWRYGRAVSAGKASAKSVIEYIIRFLQDEREELQKTSYKDYFRAKQNAIVLKNAELFYTLGISSNISSWNSRVKHMSYTIKRLLDYYGVASKGIVWAHNTHVGDARYTDMKLSRSLNIGQLLREDLGRDNVFIIGFGSFYGTLNAGRSWGSAEEVMKMPEADKSSVEYAFAQSNKQALYILFDNSDRAESSPLSDTIPHRAIGVTYNPDAGGGSYVNTILPERYDAFIFFRETNHLSSFTHKREKP